VRRFEKLPEGYEIRRGRVLTSSSTRREMTDGGEAALREIAAETPRWTEWGGGHGTSMYSGACERRGYIEVAIPDNPARGRYLYRATRSGVLLANKWRKEAGMPPLPVPAATLVANTAATSVPLTREEVESVELPSEDLGVGVRGDEWPENLTTWELHDAILAERDVERLRMLNAELQARLDATPGIAVEVARV
jgi:hypothetical protein